MSRLKFFMPILLVVFAMGVLASSPASADTCSGGSHFVFCNDNNAPLVGKEVLGTAGLMLLAALLGGLEFKFHCNSGDLKETLEELGRSTGLILFLNCKEEKPAGCKLTATDEAGIDMDFIGVTESATSGTLTGTKAGEVFLVFHMESAPGETCALPGEFPVTGKQKVETPKGASFFAEQEIIAKKSGSSLKFGGQSATLSTTTKNAHLASGLAWAILAGE